MSQLSPGREREHRRPRLVTYATGFWVAAVHEVNHDHSRRA